MGILILVSLLASLLGPLPAHARLDPAATYPVSKDHKESGPDFQLPPAYESSVVTDFQSFDPASKSVDPLIASHTEQVMNVKQQAPAAGAAKTDPKKAAPVKTELSFQKFVSASRVRVFSLARPIETKADLGAALAGLTLISSPDAQGAAKFENLDQFRRDALARSADPASRVAINTIFQENVLGKTGVPGQDQGCLATLGHRKPGDRWQAKQAGALLKLDCAFEGWSDSEGHPIAVVTLHIPKQKVTVKQPNGVPGVTETESDGTLYLDAKAGEMALRMISHITAEPAEEELKRLKAQGREPPRNRSEMTLLSRISRSP